MKIKQFINKTDSFNAVDDKINEFIQDKNVIDVKLATGYWERVVLVMYNDKGKNEDEK